MWSANTKNNFNNKECLYELIKNHSISCIENIQPENTKSRYNELTITLAKILKEDPLLTAVDIYNELANQYEPNDLCSYFCLRKLVTN